MTYYKRKSPRIPGYDYSSSNYYFITICTHEHRCIFGLPNCLNRIGRIAEKEIEDLNVHYENISIDKYVVMPNHIHIILVIEDSYKNPNLNQIVAQYKSGVTRKIREFLPNFKIWQRSYHDHVIRDQKGYEKIWTYIENNPLKWEEDCFYCMSEENGIREGQDPPLQMDWR